jgi:hypothetical protein
MEGPIYGIAAEFDDPGKLVEAARAAREHGYRRFEAYTPYPVEGLGEFIRARDPVPPMVLGSGLAGAVIAWALQNYVAILQYPTNIGGRPLFSWPAFVPVLFELTVLFAGGAAFFGALWLCGLPLLHHPVFNIDGFARASRDRFFLCIEARDPKFFRDSTTEFLLRLGPLEVWKIEED